MTNDRLKEITAELNRTTSDEIVGVSYGFKTTGGKTTDQRVIVFNVIRKKPLSEIPENERIPSQIEIDGEMFDTDVIEGIISRFEFDMCQPDFYDWQQNTPGNRNVHRPLMGGVSVTNFTDLNQYVGTLGFIAVDNETNSLVGISNNHVLCNDAFFTTERDLNDVRTNLWTPDGHIATQPNEVTSFGPNNKVGVVKKYQPIYGFPTSNVVDCAAIAIETLDATGTPTIDPSVSWNQFGITGMTSAPRFATTQEIDTLLADSRTVFYSSGRTTGPKGEKDTKLFCVANNSSVTIAYEKQGVDTVCYMNDTFELQASGTSTPNGDWCYYPSASGDSGAAILSQVEGEWVIVGMLYGGRQIEDPENPGSYLPITSLCNRIDNIVSALNISAWDGTMNGISYSNPGGTLTYVSEGSSSDKFKIIGGLKYWQMGLVNNSEYPVDPTPQPTSTPIPSPTPTTTPLPPTATPIPSPTPTPTNTPPPPSPSPSPTETAIPTATPQPLTLIYGYDHANNCTTSVSEIYYNGVQDGGTMNLTQGSTGTDNLRVAVVYPGDQILIKYRPFNLTYPCTETYATPSARLELNGVSVGQTNFDTQNYVTYSYIVQEGVNPNFVIVMENSPAPTPVPSPTPSTYTLTLQGFGGGDVCSIGYVRILKNGSEVARITKSSGTTGASWGVSSITFTQTDNLSVQSYSNGMTGSSCVQTFNDTIVQSKVNGSIVTTSRFNDGSNGQTYTLQKMNQTISANFSPVVI